MKNKKLYSRIENNHNFKIYLYFKMNKLDVHQYDNWINSNKEYIHQIVKIDEKDIDDVWQKIIHHSKKYSARVQKCVQRIYNSNDFDPNIGMHTKKIGSYVFNKLKEEMYDIFYLQFDDIHSTNGYCPQGQTNRFLQVLFSID
jgi:uncharacterized protein (DUF2461 family)